MRFLSALRGGRSSKRTPAKSLVAALRGTNGEVSDSVWKKCMADNSFEDALDDALPVRIIRELSSNAVRSVCERCVRCLEEAVEKENEKDGLEEEAELKLENATLLLVKLLAHVKFPGEVFWADGGTSLGGRVVNAVLGTLFLRGWAVETADDQDDEESKAQESKSESGVDAERLWEVGVGPEPEEEPGKVGNEMISNRHLLLQTLLAALRHGREGPPLDTTETTSEEAAKRTTKWLAWLCDPECTIPRRPELLYSLLSVGLNYDPHGYGVPYGRLFRGSGEEENSALALQVAGLLLQREADSSVPDGQALRLWCPQQRIDSLPPVADIATGHVFRSLLATIKQDREVEFLFEGFTVLFGAASDAENTYLPGSMKPPKLCPELLVVLFHLSASNAFVAEVCRRHSPQQLAECVLNMSFEELEESDAEDDKKVEKEEGADVSLQLIVAATMVRLTAHRDFSAALNDEAENPPDDALQNVPAEASVADVCVLTLCKHASDRLLTAQTNPLHHAIVECFFVMVCNLSVFYESMSKQVVLSFFSLFDRCCKPQVVRKGSVAGIIWMPYFLEFFENLVHYQYLGNRDLVYGMLTRIKTFEELVEIAKEHAGEPQTESAAAAPQANGKSPSANMPPEWWKVRYEQLMPIVEMLQWMVPRLEAEVERQEIANAEDAKKLLPRTVLGLLPPPHLFTTRTLGSSKYVHKACNACLWHRVMQGPLAPLWDEDEDNEENEDEANGEDDNEDDDEEEEEDAQAKAKVKQVSKRKGKATSAAAVPPQNTEEKPAPVAPPATSDPATTSQRSIPEQKQAENAQHSTSPKADDTPKSKLPELATPPVTTAAPAAPPADPAAALKQQLEAAAAAGLDINALLQSLHANQPGADAPAPAAAAPTPAAEPDAAFDPPPRSPVAEGAVSADEENGA